MRKLILVAVVLGLMAALPGSSTAWRAQRQGISLQFGQRPPDRVSPEEAQQQRDQAKLRNKERQEKLKADTDKLLQLATELKQYVDKTNENILSVGVIKKTEEIEKLAKSVREKMKTYEAPPEEPLPAR